jgi:hypothetical protein
VNDLDQLLGRLCLRCASIRIEKMLPDMVLDDFGDEAVERAAAGRGLLAILGPGLIVMVGDNDAGAFGTYTQAGQNYGTTLLWTLLLLVPVLYVKQEMVTPGIRTSTRKPDSRPDNLKIGRSVVARDLGRTSWRPPTSSQA